jgi:NAD(P)-dependent dehydrogenase (short-subunit alcohol dehydrogenase family)
MKIIVVGATGIIGAKVVGALSTRHEVVGVARGTERKLNLQEPATMRALFEQVREVDAVVCCAGSAIFKPLTELTDADYELGLRSKLMGQVSLARIGMDHLRDGGSITLTTGTLAMRPMPGSASISMVNAGLEGFVSPPWVKETMMKLHMDPTPGMASADVAKAYVSRPTRLTAVPRLDANFRRTTWNFRD